MVVEAPATAALAVFATLLLVRLSVYFYSRVVPKASLRPEEVELAKQIKELHREANALSTPSTFAKSAKIKRAAATKEKELFQLRQKRSPQSSWWLSPYYIFPVGLKATVYILLVWWFWHTSVALIPRPFLQPFGRLMGNGRRDSTEDLVKVGIIPWMIMSSRVIDYLSRKIARKH